MTAAGTEAVEFEAVGLNGKSIASSDFLLEFFDFAVLKLDDFAAARTNEVIVMPLMRDVIVLGLRSEVPGLGESGVAKKIQRPVNGGQSEMRISFGELMIHGFRGDVFLPEKRCEDEFALAGELQLMLSQMFL